MLRLCRESEETAKKGLPMSFMSRLRGAAAPVEPVAPAAPVEPVFDAAALAVPRAVLAPAVLTMAADGHVAEAEMAMLQNLCAFSPLYARLPEGAVEHMIGDLLEDLKSRGADEVIGQTADVLTRDLCETAFCYAMRLAMVDGVLVHREKQALSEIAERLALPDAKVDQIIEVIAMMQRAG